MSPRQPNRSVLLFTRVGKWSGSLRITDAGHDCAALGASGDRPRLHHSLVVMRVAVMRVSEAAAGYPGAAASRWSLTMS